MGYELSSDLLTIERWIGRMQLFLNFIIGVISGRLFDKGYL
jgi:hypothetical protein